jgi:hypothetical protein
MKIAFAPSEKLTDQTTSPSTSHLNFAPRFGSFPSYFMIFSTFSTLTRNRPGLWPSSGVPAKLLQFPSVKRRLRVA